MTDVIADLRVQVAGLREALTKAQTVIGHMPPDVLERYATEVGLIGIFGIVNAALTATPAPAGTAGIAAHMPSREWLRAKIESDPDAEIEGGVLHPEATAPHVDLAAENARRQLDALRRPDEALIERCIFGYMAELKRQSGGDMDMQEVVVRAVLRAALSGTHEEAGK